MSGWHARWFRAAAAGLAATLLYGGPVSADVAISSGATENMNCVNGVCSPTAKHAVLNVSDLTSLLAGGDVKVVTGQGALSIAVDVAFTWANDSRLTLDAADSVVVYEPVTVAGTGAFTILTNDGGSGGDLRFLRRGHVTFWDLNSNLTINGNTYVLVTNLHNLAKAIKHNASGYYALAKKHNAARDGTYKNSPVVTYLSGTFEGLGNTISGLRIANDSAVDNLGLFARIAFGGIVRDLQLANVNISGQTTAKVGAMAGDNWGTIQNVDVSGTLVQLGNPSNSCAGSMTGFNENNAMVSDATAKVEFQEDGSISQAIGGLVGCNNGSIRFSASTGSVTATGNSQIMGGLVGQNGATGTIVSSSASGKLMSESGDGIEGGLVGQNQGTIQSSFAAGDVAGCNYCGGLVALNNGGIATSNASGAVAYTNVANSVGGLVAVNSGSIDQSYATGSGTGGQQTAVGGLVGNSNGYIRDCYAFGAATAGQGGHAGGLVGHNSGIGLVERAYSLGVPHAEGGEAGGSIGDDTGSAGIDADYWDFDTSGITDPSQGAGNRANDPGITGLTDQQLKSALPAGFDSMVWGRKRTINNGYPYLLANPPSK